MGTSPSSETVSVVIPTLNEAGSIAATLDVVARLDGILEVIVVDGGSTDGTPEIVRGRVAATIEAPRGRGSQLHAGALAARGSVLWFLHADTHPPADALAHIREALADPAVAGGHFAIRFDGQRKAARLLTWLYPRLRYLGLVYGDAAFFIRREAYEAVGGFRPHPIFEDLDLQRRVRRIGRLVRLPSEVVSSSRRFEGRSFAFTFAWWTVLQVLYWVGVPPRHLGRLYAHIRGPRRTENRE